MSFLCGCMGSKRRKQNGGSKGKVSRGDKSVKVRLRHHSGDAAIFQNFLEENSRLQHENLALRRELECRNAAIKTDTEQDRELAANLGLQLQWAPAESQRGAQVKAAGARATEGTNRPILPSNPESVSSVSSTAGLGNKRSNSSGTQRCGGQGRQECDEDNPQHTSANGTGRDPLGNTPMGNFHSDVDQAETDVTDEEASDDCADGDATPPRHANRRPEETSAKPKIITSSEGSLRPGTTSLFPGETLAFVDDHFEKAQVRREHGSPGDQTVLHPKEGSAPPMSFHLPEKLLQFLDQMTMPEVTKLEREYWDKKFAEIKATVEKQKEEQQELVKEKAAELRGGQRQLQGGLEALEAMLKVGQQPPAPTTPQAHCLPPHIKGIALDVQGNFFTLSMVKDFFRHLGMNPAEVERTAHAQNGLSGPRDVFWSLLVSHDLALSLVGRSINMADFLDACEASHIPTWQCSVMPKAHRRVLENCLLELVVTLNVDLLKPFLRSAGILTSPNIRDYVMDCAAAEQVMHLLDVLPMLGESALYQLMDALLNTDQPHVAKILADELQRGECRVASGVETEEEAGPGAGLGAGLGAESGQTDPAFSRTKSLHFPRHRGRRNRRSRSVYGGLTSVQEDMHMHYDHKNQRVTMAAKRE